MLTIRWIVFIVVTGVIFWVSRCSLKSPQSHGFYRFFAWELILILFVVNMTYWFIDPLSPHQIIAWALLVICLAPLIWGVRLFRQHGQIDPSRSDAPALIGIEKTTQLVTTGVYRYIRHPFYSSLLFLAWGIFFKHPDWIGGILAAAATNFLVLTARREETENIAFFGKAYREYMRHTKMFIPYLF